MRHLVVPLLLATVLFLVSMRLPWHHHVIPAAGYTVIYGIQGANWLIVVGAITAAVSVRFWFVPPGWTAKWLLSLLTFLLVLGMFADYVDAQTRAAQLYVSAYFGPGFYVGLAGLASVVLATVLVWRARD